MFLKIKKKEGRKYYQAWQMRDGKEVFIAHLGTLDIIVLQRKVVQELKKDHPEVYRQMRDLVGLFSADNRKVGQE